MSEEKNDISRILDDLLNILHNPNTDIDVLIQNSKYPKKNATTLKKIQKKVNTGYYPRKDVEKFIDKANNTLLSYARHRYSKELSLTNEDTFDSLATSLNFLGQELNNSTVTTHYLNDVFSSIGDIILVVNKVGHILYINDTGCEILGYKEADLKDMSIETILEKGVNLHDLLITQTTEHPINFVTFAGQTIPVSLKISNFERSDNPMMGYVMVARDLSVLLKHQKEIQEKNKMIVRANENLERAHQHLKIILDSIDALVYITEIKSNKLLFVNAYGRKMWNISTEASHLKRISINNDTAKAFTSQNRPLTQGGKPAEMYQWEFQNHTDGRWYDCRDKVINWSDKRLVRLVIATDISKRKMAEKELLQAKEKAEDSDFQHRFLMENMHEGVMYLNAKGEIIYANDAATRILGSPFEQLYNKTINDSQWKVINDDGSAIPLDSFPGLSTLTTCRPVKDYEICVLTPGAKNYKWIKVNSVPRFSKKRNKENINLVVITLEDITHQKDAEKGLKIKESLEKKILLAEESLKFKQNFLANMSHEIRTPLVGVLGITDALGKTNLNEKQLEYLRILQVSGESLRGIIDDVLDYSKIEAGKIQIRKNVFSIKDTLKSTFNLFKNIAQKGIQMQWSISDDVPEYIEADELRINQIIRNLLSNAVKFTEQGSITLSACLVEKSHKNKNTVTIKVMVTDTGIGIPVSRQNELFKPFVQLYESNQKKFDGTGLGLSICKEIVSRHGGDIGVESKVNKGSTFWFTFQAKATDKPLLVKKETSRITSKFKNLTILLVEDNLVNQKVFSINLKYLGHNVILANNGQDAIERLKTDKFDLILMDIQMPVMDGITATKKLKETYQNIAPIVGLSANAFEGDREKYMAMGMDEYLTKPLNVDAFLEVLDKLF